MGVPTKHVKLALNNQSLVQSGTFRVDDQRILKKLSDKSTKERSGKLPVAAQFQIQKDIDARTPTKYQGLYTVFDERPVAGVVALPSGAAPRSSSSERKDAIVMAVHCP